jgi:hypothetical protein
VISAFFKLAGDVAPFGIWKNIGGVEAPGSFDALSVFGNLMMDITQSLHDEILKGCSVKLKETIDPVAEEQAELASQGRSEEKGKMGKMKDKMLKTLKNVGTSQAKAAVIDIPAVNVNVLVIKINSLWECINKTEGFKSTISEECLKLIDVSREKNSILCSFFQNPPSAETAINLIATTQVRLRDSIPRMVDLMGEKLVKTKIGMIYRRLYFPTPSVLNISNSSFVADMHACVAFLVDMLGKLILVSSTISQFTFRERSLQGRGVGFVEVDLFRNDVDTR